MIVVAGALAVVLAALAALHLYWAAGGVWPGTDARSCARATAGFRGIDRMPPPSAALGVAAALSAAALLALGLAGTVRLPFAPLLPIAGAAAAFVFIGRGLAGFTPWWRRLTPEMPFARNDVRYFSPLCLLLGGGFAILSAHGAAS